MSYTVHGSGCNASIIGSSRELRQNCNGLSQVPRVPPAVVRSAPLKPPAQPLQPRTTMGDGLETCSIQNSTSPPPPPLIFNPPAPETCDPLKPRRQTNQLQAQSTSTSVTLSVFGLFIGLETYSFFLFFFFSIFLKKF